MEIDRIRQYIDWFAGSGLQSFELEEDDFKIKLSWPEGPVQASPVATRSKAETAVPRGDDVNETPPTGIEAPLYGICYLSPAPGEPPFVQAGQGVKAGETLCLMETMKVLNKVLAPRDGVVTEILVQDGAEAEQGQILLRLE